MKRKKTGFTLVELLTVLAIITMLVGLLVPSMSMVRRLAKETKQKAQLTSIGLALTAFRDEHGDYPPSRNAGPIGNQVWDYCGAQKLAEALLGRDLLGFHPQSNWSAIDSTFYPLNPDLANLDARKGRYLELATASAFKLDALFDGSTGMLEGNTYVICDVFGAKEITVGGKIVRAGTPILYYRANTSSKQMEASGPWDLNIYNVQDNAQLVVLGKVGNPAITHPLLDSFYSPDVGVIDPKVAVLWPYRPDSYILISAGTDGRYGTTDDITNFGN